MEKQHKMILFVTIIAIVIVLVFLGAKKITGNVVSSDSSNELSKHLTNYGAVMYGTEWCSYCKKQKELFGNSFKYVNYVDCDLKKDECISAGITGYPTWRIDGQSYPGVQQLELLAELTGYSD